MISTIGNTVTATIGFYFGGVYLAGAAVAIANTVIAYIGIESGNVSGEKPN